MFYNDFGYYPPIYYDYYDQYGEYPEPIDNYEAYALGDMPLPIDVDSLPEEEPAEEAPAEEIEEVAEVEQGPQMIYVQ